MRSAPRSHALRTAAALACLLLAAPALPARADDATTIGLSVGSDLVNLAGSSPLSSNGSMVDLSGGTSIRSLGESADLSSVSSEAFAVTEVLADHGMLSLSQAQLQAQAQALARAEQLAASQSRVGADGCPTSAPASTLRSGADSIGIWQLCADSVAQAPTPEAAKAIKWALTQLGAPYACGGSGRDATFRFDCSSLVSRAYSQGAGVKIAKPYVWSPTTYLMLPSPGFGHTAWSVPIDPGAAKPGDLVLYETEPGVSQHVVMLLAHGYMVHTNRCGDVAHVTRFWGFSPGFASFLGARRVDASKAPQ